MLTDAGLGPSAVRRLDKHFDGAVEFGSRRVDVTLLQLLLTCREMAFRCRDQGRHGIFSRGGGSGRCRGGGNGTRLRRYGRRLRLRFQN